MCVLQVDRIAGVFESDTSQHDLNTGDYSAEDRSIHILIPEKLYLLTFFQTVHLT